MQHENLWAPWRRAYLRELERKAGTEGWTGVATGGFLREYFLHPEHDDEAGTLVAALAPGRFTAEAWPQLREEVEAEQQQIAGFLWREHCSAHDSW